MQSARVWLGTVGWAVLGTGALAVQAPPALSVDVNRARSGAATEVRHVACQGAGLPDLSAVLTLEASGSFAYRVVGLETNEAAHTLLMEGQNVAQVRGLYGRYVVQGQPVGRLTFSGLLGAWKFFGLKFDWQSSTYHCQLS